MIRLHLGCGPNILEGYINIDKFYDDPMVMKADALMLPFADESVDEVMHQQLAEHLDFHQEKQAFDEWYRVLKVGGTLCMDVPDFEWVVGKFIWANDDFKEFYKKEDHHYFGHGYDMNERWSSLICHIFGNQSGDGQFHKNAYTKDKFVNIFKHYGYSQYSITTFMYERFKLLCLRATAVK
jgi:predicted SAM-dependent methyltransferase